MDRGHHTQLLHEQITHEPADTGDSVGITGRGAPTFHEIRSLGGALLLQRGWTPPEIQRLMGHASEHMTRGYLEGHEAPWTTVSAQR